MARALILAAALLGQAALAQGEPASDGADRLLPLGISASTNANAWTASTGARASNAGAVGLRVSESLEYVPLSRLTVGVSLEYRDVVGLTPEATAKYQLLDQRTQWIDAAAALKYKQVGFDPNGGEMEAVLAAGRQQGPAFATLNLVAGAGLVERDVDVEAYLGAGYRVLPYLVVGANTQGKWLLGDPAAEVTAAGGRPSEFLGGAFVGLTTRLLDASLLGGFLSPQGTVPAGPLVMMRLSFKL